jgi:hypothetical protein
MSASRLLAFVAILWLWAPPGKGQEAAPRARLVATARLEKRAYRAMEPIWVRIEVVNQTDKPWSFRKDVDMYDYIDANVSCKGKPAKETAYRRYARKSRYITNPPQDGLDLFDPDDPRFDDNLLVIQPGGTYWVWMLANLGYDMTEPGEYTMRFGVPYFSAKEGELDGGIAWTEPLVVKVTGPPESPGDR